MAKKPRFWRVAWMHSPGCANALHMLWKETSGHIGWFSSRKQAETDASGRGHYLPCCNFWAVPFQKKDKRAPRPPAEERTGAMNASKIPNRAPSVEV